MRILTTSIAAFQILISLMLGFLFLNPAHTGIHHTCPITLVSGVACPEEGNLPSLLTHYFGGVKVFLSFTMSEIVLIAAFLFVAFLSLRLLPHLSSPPGLFSLRRHESLSPHIFLNTHVCYIGL